MSNSTMSKFEVIECMVKEVASGNCPSLIVSGPPGIGKTFTVLQTLQNFAGAIAPLLGITSTYEALSGTMTSVNLYMKLYEHRHPGSVLVLDDMDSIFSNETSLNLLKGALDLSQDKMLGYFAESASLKKTNVPKQFVFKGSVIFLTNIDFNDSPKALKPHLDALMSRSHYVDMGLRSPAEKMSWVVKTIKETDIISDLAQEEQTLLIGFMIENRERMNEISLRMVKKLASLSKIGSGWQDVAAVTCLN